MEIISEKWIKEFEAASVLGLSVSTMRSYRWRRCGPNYSKVGRAVRYNVAELYAFMRTHRVVLNGNASKQNIRKEVKS